MKISREGIVLIKSFEGFRPRAIRREDGGWIIGYGHTLSAREGASVSEADAELLLRYDLLPVEMSVNQAGPAFLNQHQFDALVSFAHSVGVDRFKSSDVLAHLVQGDADQAADALMGWPEPAQPPVSLRRRVAERALFRANPDTDVVLSDLLAATLDIVAASTPGTSPETPTASLETAPPAADTPDAIQTEPGQTEPDGADPRTAAVSVLLGETDAVGLPGFPPPPPASEAAAENDIRTDTFAAPANDVDADGPTAPAVSDPFASPGTTATQLPEPELEPEPEPGHLPEVMVDADPATASAREDATVPTDAPTDASTPPTGLPAERIAITLKRYNPYGAAMVGPLPFLQPTQDLAIAPEPVVTPAIDPQLPATPTEAPVVAESEPATDISPIPAAIEVEPLILSPDDDAPTPALSREPWTVEERVELSDSNEAGLFGEDLSLTQGGAPILRHGDLEVPAPASFDWSETGAFIIMGAVGLTAFGAAMAAFRLAAEQSGGDEIAIIAWVLALIGAGCVGVSSFNLYRRWGLPGGDN